MDFDLNGVRMRVTSVSSVGALSGETTFAFEQKGRVVSARYRGGPIADGYLVGWLVGSRLEFRYVQIDDTGRMDSGVSEGELQRLADSRVRLTESFQWETRPGLGVNIFEQY